ncbi:hypothetical protein GCM10011504_03560 [Siccirubricoccus deserti]|nr:hypothetical protein GCM10011504_03560 [Siccirubricoccus deserti]
MVDMLAIMLVTGACLYVTIRAVLLDRMLPWFATPVVRETEREKPASPAHDTTSSPPATGWRARTTGAGARPDRQMDH